ncbi:MAG: putative glycosyltransferase EpsF [Elusimicrobia bacterium ADurb.Bin231]|nr:MAG: putative glycosyltransferase EpsF [Elusimicrobia bacterium ADurb.Bin231]
MTNKRRIFHLITSLNIGGTERFLLTVLKNLKSKYDFSVGYLKERGYTADEIEKIGITVQKFDFLSLVRYLKSFKPEILHTHLYRANIIGRIAGRVAKLPAVISSQRSIDGWKNRFHSVIDGATSIYCDLVIANSAAAADILAKREKVPSNKIEIVYNGQEEFAPSKEALLPVLTVGYVGRLHKEKGVYLLPEIAKALSMKKPEFRFVIIGDGPELGNIRSKINSYGLKNNISFLGWQENRGKIYSEFDVLILPSEEESFPQALLESFAYGVPAVASDVGGVREILEDGKNGFLVKKGDVSGYAAGILAIAENNYCYRHFSANALAKASEYSVEKMIRSVDSIYERFLR